MNEAALHQAIYTRLANFTALTTKVTGIYSRVPQAANSGDDSAFPFVTFNVPNIASMDTKTTDGANAVFQVHVWSRTTSDLARKAVTDEVYNALHKYDLPIAGANTIACGFEAKTEFEDADGKTVHAVVSFRVTYDEI